jgi:hypothetical protein
MSREASIQYVRQLLGEHVPELSFDHRKAKGNSVDLLVCHGSNQLAIVVKELSQLRVQGLIGQLSAGALQASEYAKKKKALPVVIVLVPKIGQRAMKQAKEFMERYAYEIGWGVADLRGKLRLMLPGFDVDVDFPHIKVKPQGLPRKEKLQFSDLNRWMMKILLLAKVDQSHWSGPRDPIYSPGQLQVMAGVSQNKAYSFVRMLEQNDFMRRSQQGLKLVRVEELIDLWFSEEKLRPARHFPVCSIFGSKPDLANLASAQPSERAAALGGFSACSALGVLHSLVDQIAIHIKIPLDNYLERFQLEVCDVRDAQLYIIESKNNESVFRGVVESNNMLVADIFQAALDVVANPVRGQEQAEYLKERILSQLHEVG